MDTKELIEYLENGTGTDKEREKAANEYERRKEVNTNCCQCNHCGEKMNDIESDIKIIEKSIEDLLRLRREREKQDK